MASFFQPDKRGQKHAAFGSPKRAYRIMSSNLERSRTPEERELEKKKGELAALEGELAQRELDLATLKNELHVVEGRYLRTVGVLYAELDDIEAQIAETQARQRPNDPRLHEQAAEARAKAVESADSVGRVPEEPYTDFVPAESLRKLYREVARQLHPDLTTDETARTRRTRLMAEANQAYAEGNEPRLRAILNEWESSPESVRGEGVAAELVRTIRNIHQVERRLNEIDAEAAALKRSDLYILTRELEAANAQRRNLFSEMAEDLNEQIANARTKLATLSSVTRP